MSILIKFRCQLFGDLLILDSFVMSGKNLGGSATASSPIDYTTEEGATDWNVIADDPEPVGYKHPVQNRLSRSRSRERVDMEEVSAGDSQTPLRETEINRPPWAVGGLPSPSPEIEAECPRPVGGTQLWIETVAGPSKRKLQRSPNDSYSPLARPENLSSAVVISDDSEGEAFDRPVDSSAGRQFVVL